MRRISDRISGKENLQMRRGLVVVRGGGDLATGTIHRLWSAGFTVVVLEISSPAAIRRPVSVCEAVYDGETVVEGMRGVRISDCREAAAVIEKGSVPVLIDPDGESIKTLKPSVVVDAILAKVNLGTRKGMAPLTIALGPGFEAGVDTDYVIETKRGHDLGKIICQGTALPNTGIPGDIGGYTDKRVIRSRQAGVFRNVCKIGDIVEAGQEIARIECKAGESYTVIATITGIVRGLLRDGYHVTKGFKVADIDPRKEELKNCFTISDKARCIAGSVLELCVAFCREE